jgi:hypothetical protein
MSARARSSPLSLHRPQCAGPRRIVAPLASDLAAALANAKCAGHVKTTVRVRPGPAQPGPDTLAVCIAPGALLHAGQGRGGSPRCCGHPRGCLPNAAPSDCRLQLQAAQNRRRLRAHVRATGPGLWHQSGTPQSHPQGPPCSGLRWNPHRRASLDLASPFAGAPLARCHRSCPSYLHLQTQTFVQRAKASSWPSLASWVTLSDPSSKR